MKLIIQIPCFNEEEVLPKTLSSLPREVEGFDRVEWLIIDDGSTDRTVPVAREHGVDHIVRFTKNQGLAKGYIAGLDAGIRLGADVIVNTDADNQYNADDIPLLIKPILDGNADIVIGERPIDSIQHFSMTKKMLQKLGSWVVRKVSMTEIHDAPSGFRAISRDAAMRLNIFNDYTYTLESIIQAGMKGIAIESVPIRVNEDIRPSKLVKNIFDYVKKSVVTILRIFVVYKPFRFFFSIGTVLFLCGVALGIRFLVFYFSGEGSGHVQSLILASILLGIGFQTILVAFLSDLLAVNRQLLEDIKYRLHKEESRIIRKRKR